MSFQFWHPGLGEKPPSFSQGQVVGPGRGAGPAGAGCVGLAEGPWALSSSYRLEARARSMGSGLPSCQALSLSPEAAALQPWAGVAPWGPVELDSRQSSSQLPSSQMETEEAQRTAPGLGEPLGKAEAHGW